jgi:hypothetical protein
MVGVNVFYFGSMGKIEEYLQFWYNHTKNLLNETKMNEKAGIHLKWSDSCFFLAATCIFIKS